MASRITSRADRLVEELFQRKRRPPPPTEPYSVGEHLKQVNRESAFRRLSRVRVPDQVTLKEFQ